MELNNKSPFRGLGLEICANSVESAIAAQQGGADRIELCTNLAEGGTTPSYGQIKWCVENLNTEVWPLIRPRGGDFLYSDAEFENILEDISYCKQIGCKGLVTGLLNKNGDIDEQRCAKIISVASPMPVAFHRAFDMSADLSKSLEKIIKLGFVRILTSGGKENAFVGAKKLKELVIQADNRIEIMPGAGINADNLLEIAQTTGARNFHTTAKSIVASKMQFRNEASKMAGENTDEFSHEQTDLIKVKVLKEILNHL
ncbi:copper homeostasis protein CutC [Pedobacter sp. SL55]|uniref:copper homeostasis protein CutC n=1 Tax=Pedobacter sp. SL55 TaxID=2995161 RepID=UPI00226F4790|nr:copper homeostasis protein CutC [Pedobacter sp. SL55]WAC39847.1 copper homeostasis protein CutC [Pedobacter sp. SL55]